MRISASTTLRSFPEYRTVVLLVAVILMAGIALPWLTINLEKFLSEGEPWGAVDLKYRYMEVQLWFAGQPVYGEVEHAVYPPASYAMLWPFLGWLAFAPAKVVWAAIMLLTLGALAYFLVQESGAVTRLERIFVVLLLLSMYPTAFSLGHGQLTIPVLAALVAGLTLVGRGPCSWQNDLVAAILILAALVKPTVSAPFFLLIIFIPGRLRPALLVVVGYVALTLFAITFQSSDFFTLHRQWAEHSVAAAWWSAHGGGYADQHSLLVNLHLKRWMIPAAVLTILALGYWMYRHRHGDMWILLGVTALVSRLWVHHRSYDDMLVVLPMIALFRMTKKGASRNENDVAAGILLSVAVMVMFIPAVILFFPEWKIPMKMLQSVFRIVLLIFLVYRGMSSQPFKPLTV